MSKIKKILLGVIFLFVFQVFPKTTHAQSLEIECNRHLHYLIDSFLTEKMGEEEYLKERDSISFWMGLTIDSFGSVISSVIKNHKNISIDLINDLDSLILKNKFKCFYLLYSKAGSNVFHPNRTGFFTPFVPGRYSYLKGIVKYKNE